MKGRKKTILKMARWTAKELAGYSPAARGRKIRQALGDSPSARSFVNRLMPEFYEDAYGDATSSASGRSVSAQTASLHARPR